MKTRRILSVLLALALLSLMSLPVIASGEPSGQPSAEASDAVSEAALVEENIANM